MSAKSGNQEQVDVLIVTAVRDEYAAVLAVDTSAKPGSTWEKRIGSAGLEVAFRDFVTAEGVLRVAVTQALGMGGAKAVGASAQLLRDHEVRCLAMCGVCAGRKGEVALGDVIIADRLWKYDTGKLRVAVVEGERVVHEQGDIDMYRLHPPAWTQAAQRFEVDRGAAWLALRPTSYEAQGDWILERVLKGFEPATDPDRPTRCENFDKALGRLRKKALLEDGTMTLTKEGRQHIELVLRPHGNELPDPPPFQTAIGPIASGSKVIEDDQIFLHLAGSVRKVLGVEMEAAALAELAHAQGLECSVVMKGVMDHADADKNDNFKAFAARASAECLIAFLTQHMKPRSWKRKDPLDHILVPGTLPLPPLASPAALLIARHEIVPFLGRGNVLEDLLGWCAGDGVALARLVHAPGGMGKTRLLIELCKQMRAKGWRAGFVPKELKPKRFAELVSSGGNTLAVIDYAESRARIRDLLLAAGRLRGNPGEGRLRVVLLARGAGDWWEELLRSEPEITDLLRDEAPVGLSPLALRVAEREALFHEAVARFAEVRGQKLMPAAAPALADPQYERVLYIHMAALAVVDGRSSTAKEVMGDTLDQEEEFWTQKFERKNKDGDPRLLKTKIGRIVAALTLRGGASDELEAQALADRVGEGRDEDLVLFLRDIYPGGAADQGAYLAGLEPALLGEAMVHRSLSKERGRAGAALDRAFEGAGERAIQAGFATLGRLSGEHVEAEAWIARVLERDVSGRAVAAFEAARSIAVDDPIKERAAHTRLGMALAKALEKDGTIEIARHLEELLPQSTVALREVALWVVATLLKHLPAGTAPLSRLEQADTLNQLGSRQGQLGQREAAFASTEKALGHYRKLLAAYPDRPEALEVLRPYLAWGLHNLAIRHGELGQRDSALEAIEEAVGHYRKLATARPEEFLSNLAQSLRTLSVQQRNLGQREAALESAGEALKIRRELSATHQRELPDGVAMHLDTLGSAQRDLGQWEAARHSAEEALAEYRSLVATRPEAFLPGLADVLQNLGNVQSDLGQHQAALASVEEAVAHLRKLAAMRPEAFLPDLAQSLINLGKMLIERGIV